MNPLLLAWKLDGVDVLDGFDGTVLDGFDGTTIEVGSVTLLGAGPGGVDLLTIGGARVLAAADVVVYDRLVDPAILDLAPVAAERIPVGKAKGSGTTQAEINRILIERASRGLRVVRLKGGDPFVFGRGGEEMEALAQAGIPVEVVPGLSSAVAAATLAGIPLTHREVAASFTVLAGHRVGASGGDGGEGVEGDERVDDWDALARSASTLIVLMGASTASAVAGRLRAAGRPGDQSVAVVHRAGGPGQRVALTTIDGLVDGGSPLPSPSVLIVGDVVERFGRNDRPLVTAPPSEVGVGR